MRTSKKYMSDVLYIKLNLWGNILVKESICNELMDFTRAVLANVITVKLLKPTYLRASPYFYIGIYGPVYEKHTTQTSCICAVCSESTRALGRAHTPWRSSALATSSRSFATSSSARATATSSLPIILFPSRGPAHTRANVKEKLPTGFGKLPEASVFLFFVYGFFGQVSIRFFFFPFFIFLFFFSFFLFQMHQLFLICELFKFLIFFKFWRTYFFKIDEHLKIWELF